MVPLSVLLFDPGFNVHCWGLASSASPIFESVSQHLCVSMGGEDSPMGTRRSPGACDTLNPRAEAKL